MRAISFLFVWLILAVSTDAMRVKSAIGTQWDLTAHSGKQSVFAIEGRSKQLIAFEEFMAGMEGESSAYIQSQQTLNGYPLSSQMSSANMNTQGAYNLVEVDTETGSIYNETGSNGVLISDFPGVDISEFGYNFECVAANPITGTIYAISQTPDTYPEAQQLGTRYAVVEINLDTKQAVQVGGFSAYFVATYFWSIMGYRGINDCTVTPNGNFYFYGYALGTFYDFDHVFQVSEPSPFSPADGSSYTKDIQGGAGIYRFDFETSVPIPIDNTFRNWGEWNMALEFSPDINNLIFHNGPNFIPLLDYNDTDSQATQFQVNHYGSISLSSGGPNYFYGSIAMVSSALKVYWLSYTGNFGGTTATGRGWEGAPYAPDPATTDFVNAFGWSMAHWADDAFIVLDRTFLPDPWGTQARASVIDDFYAPGCSPSSLTLTRLIADVAPDGPFWNDTFASSLMHSNVYAENVAVEWAPASLNACNVMGVTVVREPDFDIFVDGTAIIDYMEATGNTVGVVDSFNFTFTKFGEHYASEKVYDISFVTDAGYDITAVSATASLSGIITAGEVISFDVTGGCVVDGDAVSFPNTAELVLKYGPFSASANIAGDYNDIECRCGAGVSFCVTGATDTVSCDADGSNTVCSTCQEGSDGTACDIDIQMPIITCPANMIVNDTVGNDSGFVANVTWEEAIATDNMPLSLMSTELSGNNNFPVGETTSVTVTASDGTFEVTCSFMVTVIDVMAPVLTCPDISVEAAPGAVDAEVTFNISAFENADVLPSSDDVVLTVSGFESGSMFPIGASVVRIIATDASGLQSACSFQVTVTDFDECASGPCANNATCLDGGLDALECICEDGWNGTFCDMDIDDCTTAPCDTLGTSGCFDLGVSKYECKCNEGWTGDWCEISACQNDGTALTATVCDCNTAVTGFTGMLCDEAAVQAVTTYWVFVSTTGDLTVEEHDAVLIEILNNAGFEGDYEITTIKNEDGSFGITFSYYNVDETELTPIDALEEAEVTGIYGGNIVGAEYETGSGITAGVEITVFATVAVAAALNFA